MPNLLGPPAPEMNRLPALVPQQQLECVPDAPPGTWLSRGPDPYFVLPVPLSAGWLRVSLTMTSKVRGHLELSVLGEDGDADCIERTEVCGPLDHDFYLQLRRPVRGIRFDPLDVPGPFHLEELRVEPLSGPRTWWHALRTKLGLLRQHGIVGRTLFKGIGLLAGQFGEFRRKLWGALHGPTIKEPDYYDVNRAYEHWRRRHRFTEEERQRHRDEAARLAEPPTISVLMPVFNVPESILSAAIDSVRRQLYPHWELCIADDGSTAPHVRPLLERVAAEDSRIRTVLCPQNQGIAAASNAALSLARGEYVALLDHDDELAEHALLRVAQTIAADRTVDMIYSDEDKVEPDGRHVEPFFKPDWSPELFLGFMYTCHLGVFRTGLVRDVGGFRSDFDTAQDYDLALRVSARTNRIAHIPDVLYHWRKLPGSAARGHGAKPQAAAAARRALQDHLTRVGQPAQVEVGPFPDLHRVRFRLRGQPRVSIVIPSACRPARIHGRDTTWVAHCVESIRERSSYSNYEIVVVDNHHVPDGLAARLNRLGVKRVSHVGRFNLSAKINRGVAAASGDHVLLLNDDTEVLTPDWIECLLEYSQQEAIGVVGAKLLFPDGTLQHAGITLAGETIQHSFYRYPGKHPGYFCSSLLPRNCSAVTGACLMSRIEVFRLLGGFDESLGLHCNDIDYCLKAQTAGWRVVYTPYAQLIHYEGVSKPPSDAADENRFWNRWRGLWGRDPYYNPNLAVGSREYRIG